MRRVSRNFPLFQLKGMARQASLSRHFLRPYFRQGLSAFLSPNLRYGLTAFLRSNFTAWTVRFRKEMNNNGMCIIINSMRINPHEYYTAIEGKSKLVMIDKNLHIPSPQYLLLSKNLCKNTKKLYDLMQLKIKMPPWYCEYQSGA